jgi:hypothetical protein
MLPRQRRFQFSLPVRIIVEKIPQVSVVIGRGSARRRMVLACLRGLYRRQRKPGSSPVRTMQVYVDGVKKFEISASNLIHHSDGGPELVTDIALAAGPHRVKVQPLDASGALKLIGEHCRRSPATSLDWQQLSARPKIQLFEYLWWRPANLRRLISK